jgi:hypothetical protein
MAFIFLFSSTKTLGAQQNSFPVIAHFDQEDGEISF